MRGRVSIGKQPARELPIPFVDCGALWCSCDTTMAEDAIPETCPTCGRDTKTLLEEAALNAKVTAFIESKPLAWGTGSLLAGSPVDWWARMTEAYQASLSTGGEADGPADG